MKTVGDLDLRNEDTKNILKFRYGKYSTPKAETAQEILDSIKINKIFN